MPKISASGAHVLLYAALRFSILSIFVGCYIEK